MKLFEEWWEIFRDENEDEIELFCDAYFGAGAAWLEQQKAIEDLQYHLKQTVCQGTCPKYDYDTDKCEGGKCTYKKLLFITREK